MLNGRSVLKELSHMIDHNPATPLFVLLVTSRRSDFDELAQIVQNTRWRLISAASDEEAVQILQKISFSVVLWDRDMPGIDWRAGLRWLAGAGNRPAVLLMSEVSDEYLWEEVVRAGGFDVMTRPFRKDETLACLEFAHRHWEAFQREFRRA